jgi:hypothetical protein
MVYEPFVIQERGVTALRVSEQCRIREARAGEHGLPLPGDRCFVSTPREFGGYNRVQSKVCVYPTTRLTMSIRLGSYNSFKSADVDVSEIGPEVSLAKG